jgi:hypothetical protein
MSFRPTAAAIEYICQESNKDFQLKVLKSLITFWSDLLKHITKRCLGKAPSSSWWVPTCAVFTGHRCNQHVFVVMQVHSLLTSAQQQSLVGHFDDFFNDYVRD